MGQTHHLNYLNQGLMMSQVVLGRLEGKNPETGVPMQSLLNKSKAWAIHMGDIFNEWHAKLKFSGSTETWYV